MIWLITTTSVLVAAVACWAWWHRRERNRAAEFRRAAESLDQVEDPLVFVATHFWFPALGKYGVHSEDAQKMLVLFSEALPEELRVLSQRVDTARAQIAADGDLDDERSTALRALFDAIAERGELDAELRASLASGALDWAPEAADDNEGGLDEGQRDILRTLGDELANQNSEAVVHAVDERIADEGLQGVYRAALLDCRGRALLQLDRADEAVRDFEAASRLAPNTDLRELPDADSDR